MTKTQYETSRQAIIKKYKDIPKKDVYPAMDKDMIGELLKLANDYKNSDPKAFTVEAK